MSTRTVSGGISLVAISFLLFGASAFAQSDGNGGGASADEGDAEMDELHVVGVRNPNRALTDSTVSVEVVDAERLRGNGSIDLLDQLGNEINSLHIERHAIADAATLIRPINLRGLPSDATLVLVNGKRRHRGAVVALLGGGKNQGSHGPDIAAIPSIALERVEVLRDGASAQYGSDAIAGVMNFVLRSSNDVRTLQVKYGQYFAGDGVTGGLSAIAGFPLTERGFLTASLEINGAGSTVRSVQRDDALGLSAAGNGFVREPFAQVWGSPKFNHDFRTMVNAEMPFGDNSTLYAFGNITQRDVEGGFFFRHPGQRAGVFTADGGQTLLFADLRPDDGIDCPAVPIINQQMPDELALEAALGTDGCVTYFTLFPGGFTPNFGGVISDQSIALGLRGDRGPWAYDASLVWGYSGVEYYMSDTVNPQLIGRGLLVPTDYKPGQHEQSDMVLNYEMSRILNVASGYGDVFFATGFEYRTENFVTTQGEENSWLIIPEIAAQGFGIGSNGFPGFPEEAEVDESRGSWALWADAEQDLTSNILGSFAIRFENYEDFGHTLDFKVASRIQYAPNFSIRGAYNTGFAAPTVGQSNIRLVATNYLISPTCPVPGEPCLADEVTLAPTEPLAELKGGEALQPVRSRNISLGLDYNAGGFDCTVDYFRINVDDRIARTSPIPVTPADYAALELRDQRPIDPSLAAIRFYTNDFDTRTEGLELSVAKSIDTGFMESDFTLSANYTVTTVEHFNPDIINSQRVRELEEGVPRLRFTLAATHTLNRMWSGMTRLRYYGETWEPHVYSDVYPVDVDAAVLADVEVRFTPDDRTSAAVGFENILDTYPNENPWSGIAGAEYPITSPYGFNGAFFYMRVTVHR
ncbi:MAG: TonB-dependent receptor [Gammaproteobacteria bacterium]|nr:TonB-dependent receptor [Gammaproteobacteria bacterium]